MGAPLAPIALYLDGLLSQVPKASTYPLEVVEADHFVQRNPVLHGDALKEALAKKNWDPSVQSLAAYPTMPAKMSEKLEWIGRLGNACLEDQGQVLASPSFITPDRCRPRRTVRVSSRHRGRQQQGPRATTAPPPVKPAISEEAGGAVSRMGKALLAKELSFTAKTVRVYLDESGQPFHIFHTLKVVVRRPDRLAVQSTGDDGTHDLFYDGKSVAIFFPDRKQYAVIAAAGTFRPLLGRCRTSSLSIFRWSTFLPRLRTNHF